MKYRFKKDGDDSFRSFLKKNLFVISKLAQDIGLTGPGFHYMLSGNVDRPRREHMEKLAELTETSYGIDDDGIYFQAFPEIAESDIQTAFPFFDENNTQGMSPKERNQVINYINQKCFNGKLPIEKQMLLDEVFKLDNEDQDIVLEIMKNIAKLKNL